MEALAYGAIKSTLNHWKENDDGNDVFVYFPSIKSVIWRLFLSIESQTDIDVCASASIKPWINTMNK